MNRAFGLLIAIILIASRSAGAIDPAGVQKLFKQTTPSLVAVQFTWESEIGRKELVGAGVVISEDGLVITSLAVFDMRIPDDQLTEFKIIVPHEDRDPEEIDAVFHARDERWNLAFLKAIEPRKWQPLKFEDIPVDVGQQVLSVGMLPEIASYKPYFMDGKVSALLRGEIPQVLIHGGLCGIGSPVFNEEGKAIGLVGVQPNHTAFLNDPPNALVAITLPPKFYVPTRDFLPALKNPPKAGEQIKLTWLGVPQLTGLSKDVAEVFGLQNQPAVQIGEVIPDTPADRAGLKQGHIVIKVNGKPLERGDESDELPQIFRRQLMRMNVGDIIVLTVIPAKGQEPHEIKVELEEMPRRPHLAKRFWAEDLGFSVREMVFLDTYARKLLPDAKGVIVSLIRPQSSAETGGLQNNDLVTELNREAVENLDHFQRLYKDFRKDKPNEAVVMVVLRDGQTQTVRIEPPQ